MANRRLSLLLIEDDEVDVLSIQRALEQRGLHLPIFIVSDGEQALARLRSGEIPHERLLVLLDLYLPKRSGLEVLQELRKDPTLNLLPVVLMTTSQDEQSKLDAYELNVAGFLRKPISPAELEHQITALCDFWATTEMP